MCRVGGAAKCARSVSTKWRDCRWAKSIAAIRTAPDSVRQPLREAERRKDEEAFHDVMAIGSTANIAISIAAPRSPTRDSVQASMLPACTVVGEPPSSGQRESCTHVEDISVRFDRRPTVISTYRTTSSFVRDTTWTTQTCSPIQRRPNMSLPVKLRENRSNTRRFRTDPRRRAVAATQLQRTTPRAVDARPAGSACHGRRHRPLIGR